MRIIFILIGIIILSACQNQNNHAKNNQTNSPKSAIIDIDTNKGYSINPTTQQEIKPIINWRGDTVETGKLLEANTFSISSDIFKPIKTTQISQFRKSTTSKHKVLADKKFKVVPLLTDSLESFTIGQDTSTAILINSFGDTVVTGREIELSGIIVEHSLPEIKKALPFAIKDNAKLDLQYLDVNQGLNSSYVRDILEDSRGNIWFASKQGGACMFDGQNFTYYTDKCGLPSNQITKIFEDSKGQIWFGTWNKGLAVYDGMKFKIYTEKNGICSDRIRSITETKDGRILIGTNHGFSIIKNNTIINYSIKEGLSDDMITTVIEDSKGIIWLGTYHKGIMSFDGEKFTHYSKNSGLQSNRISKIIEDKNNNLWIASYGGGVAIFNGKSYKHITEEHGLISNYLNDIYQDLNGNIWFGFNSSYLGYYDGTHFKYIDESMGLTNGDIRKILEDRYGNIWVATDGGGICKLDPNSFKHFFEDDGLCIDAIWSNLEDSKGNMWFGGWGNGACMFDGNQYTYFGNEEGLSYSIVWNMEEDHNGNIWFATSRGINKFDGNSIEVYKKEQGLCSNVINYIFEDSKERLWLGSDGNGLCIIDDENITYLNDTCGLSSNMIWKILEDKNGNIWIASNGGGLSKWNDDGIIHYSEKEGLPSNHVRSLYEDQYGNILIGTKGGGLCIYDGKKFIIYNTDNGLSNNLVRSIIEDEYGRIWLSTESGINCLQYPTNTKNIAELDVYSFNHQDGLKGMKFFNNCVLIDNENQIWWGSGKNVSMLNLDKFKINQTPPSIELTNITINEQVHDFHLPETIDNKSIDYKGAVPFYNVPTDLVLPYNQNHLEFNYSAIDWSAPHKLFYAYKMIGIDTSWSNLTKDLKVNYRNIPYGTYTFKVKAIGEAQIWSQPSEYTFTILPPWWHTWWARVIYGLMAIIVIHLTLRWRTAQLKKRQKELETEVDVATKEIRIQKEEIQEQHQEILDSIVYAKRIQSAILPSRQAIDKHLPSSFVLYKPKNVVAGDFYWLEHKDDKILFAAADCTGHGVPGAMVSVVCNNGLNRAVREHGLTTPGKILDKTREIVIKEFDKSEDDVKDGMDIALCSLQNMTLEYAGAHNPLWIIRDGEIIETKADKQPIGKFDNQTPYTTHSFQLQKNDTIYIFSDGYVDQFGGEKGKKFKSKALKELLLSIQHKTMVNQKMALNDVFETWKGNLEQIDDICIFGIRV